jgi:protocatechuate 3,4-dioxygenase beta subunit
MAAAIAIVCLRAAAQEATPCAMGGAVTDDDTGKPMERARVIATAGSYSFLRMTDEHGGFCFETLTPGDYHLIAQKAGYLEAAYPVTMAVERDSQLKPLAIKMTHYGSLSGTVLDTGGQSVPGAVVAVWQRTRSGPDEVESQSADGRGAFRFSQLPPGTYYLSVKNMETDEGMFVFPFADSRGYMPREKEVETFYSASFTFADATPVELKAGQRLDKLVLTLAKAALRRITGRIPDPPKNGFLTYSGETETSSDRGGAIPIGSDGSFIKAGLLPAKYKLELGDGKRVIARRDIDLTLGDALNITLDAVETVDIPAVIRTEGKGPAFRPGPASGLLLVPDGSDDAVPLEASDGASRFPAVERGMYRLVLIPKGQSLYVKGVTYGGETQTGGKIDLRTSREGSLEITLSSNFAEVHGRVTLSESDSNDLTVILADGAQIVEQTGTDQKGRFRMPAVAPGKYRLYAIEGFDDDDWGSPELAKMIETKSVELDLKESEKKQVNLTPVSADEWTAAVKKTGG